MRPLARTFVFNGLWLALAFGLPETAKVFWGDAQSWRLLLAVLPVALLGGLACVFPRGVDSDRDAVDQTPHPDWVKPHRWIQVLMPPFLLLLWLGSGWDSMRHLPTPLWFRLLYVAVGSAGGVLAWLSARGEWRRWRWERTLVAEVPVPSVSESPVASTVPEPERQSLKRR